jgi:hypothetical protein
LPTVRTHCPPPTTPNTPRCSHCMPYVRTQSPQRTLQQCVQVSTRWRWDDDDDLDCRGSRCRARLRHSATPRGGWIARSGGLTDIFCIMQAVPGDRDTQRCAQDYPSTTVSLLFFSRSLIRIVSPCRMSTSQRRHLRWTRFLLRAL